MNPPTWPRTQSPGEDLLAARIIQNLLTHASFPAPLISQASDDGVQQEAERISEALLRRLQLLYGVPEWDWRAFRQYFLHGALVAWKPSTRVIEQAGPQRSLVRVESSGCPLARQVANDPRVCAVCRLVQTNLTRRATPEHVASVFFESLHSLGDDGCTVWIQRQVPGDGGPTPHPAPEEST